MPRLTLTKQERQCASIQRELDAYICERRRAGVDCHTVAKTLGFGYTALNKKRKAPALFTFGELQRVASVLNISLARLIGGEEFEK